MKSLHIYFRSIICIAALACLSSCEYTFDLDKRLDGKRKLFFQCIAANADTTIVRLYQTSPLTALVRYETVTVEYSDGSTYTDERIIENTVEDNIIPNVKDKLSLTVNGQPVKLQPAVGTVPRGCLFTCHKFSPGDKISMKGGVEGIGEIHAEAVFPEPFPEFHIKRTESLMNNYYWHSLRYEASGKEEAYAVIFGRRTRTEVFYKEYNEMEWVPVKKISDLGFEYIDYELQIIKSAKDTTIVRVTDDTFPSASDSNLFSDTGGDVLTPMYMYDKYYNIWIDKADGRPGERELMFKTNRNRYYIESENSGHRPKKMRDIPGDMYYPGGEVLSSEEVFYYTFCRLSPETFRYLRSIYFTRNNELSELGLSPSMSSFTNVKGGSGVLGVCNSSVHIESKIE